MKIKINGVNYNVKISGQGEALLLLHGFTGSLKNWEPFIKDWADSNYVIAVDLLGHGETDKPRYASRYTVEKAADDLNDLFHKVCIKKSHIIGYSMGGRLALTFAVKYLEKVTSLILESSSPGLESEKERFERLKKDDSLADFIEGSGTAAFVDYWERIPLFSSQKLLSAEVKKKIHNQRLNNDVCGLANSLRGMGTGKQPSWWSFLDRLNIPVHLITGEKDKKFTEIAQNMVKNLPNAETTIVKNAGHNVHVECPQVFNEIVKEWIIIKNNGGK